MAKVLVFLPEGFEEIEAITPIDLLRRAGVEVRVAALGEGIHVTGRSGITLHADCTLAQVPLDETFDLLFLPGGPGVKHLRADPRVAARVGPFAREGGKVAAICAAPTVLLDLGLLANRRYTAHPSVAAELPDRLADERVVTDGALTTGRGAGTSLDFGLALIAQLVGPAEAEKIRNAVAA